MLYLCRIDSEFKMKTLQKSFISLLCLAGTTAAGWAQTEVPEDATSYRAEAFGSAATGLNTPFWMASNRYGVVPLNANNGYGTATAWCR